MRQVGAIPVHSLKEMADIVLTFQYLSVPGGRRLGTVGIGGGATVLATDIYASAGLVLPPFPRAFQQKLNSFVPDIAGLSLNNPVDLSAEHFDLAIYNVGKAVAEYDGIDALVFHLPLSIVPIIFAYPERIMLGYLDHIIRIRKETAIPMAAVFHNLPNGEVWQVAFHCQQKCHEAGIPAYFSIEAAARALSQYIRYPRKIKAQK